MPHLFPSQSQSLLSNLKTRFENNRHRHEGLVWEDIQQKLENNLEKLYSLEEMEATDGEPDVVGFDSTTGEYLFYDCAPESPKGRRSLCYDHIALKARKANKPAGSVMAMVNEMGIELLNEEQYRYLQQFGDFDVKTSSWVKTPEAIRKLGGALFCDKRYNHVFTYYNGAESYYAARGFRGMLRV